MQRLVGNIEVPQPFVRERHVDGDQRDGGRIQPGNRGGHERGDVGDELPADFRGPHVVEDVPRKREPVPAVRLDDIALDVAQVHVRDHRSTL
jgi:hypothetical protein